MKSTTVVSLTKIAQMLTSRIGRKPLLLALAATLACLQTAKATTRPAETADSFRDPVTPDGRELRLVGTPSASHTTNASGQEAPTLVHQASTMHHTAGGPNHDLRIADANSGSTAHAQASKDGLGGQMGDNDSRNSASQVVLNKQGKIGKFFEKYWKETLAGATLATTGAAIGLGSSLKTMDLLTTKTAEAGHFVGFAACALLVCVGIIAMAFIMFYRGNNDIKVNVGLGAVVVGAITVFSGMLVGASELSATADIHVGDIFLNPGAEDQLASAWVIAIGGFLILGALIFLAIMNKNPNKGTNAAIIFGTLSLAYFGGHSGFIITKCMEDGFSGDIGLTTVGILFGSLFGFLALANLLFSNDKNPAKLFGITPALFVGNAAAVIISGSMTVGLWNMMADKAMTVPVLSTIMFILAGVGLLVMLGMFAAKKTCYKGGNKFFGKL